MSFHCMRLLGCVIVLAVGASVGFGTSMITFDSGKNWDAVPGEAGGGWAAGWAPANGNSTTVNVPRLSLGSTSPLNAGGGGYLHLETTLTTGAHVASRRIATSPAPTDYSQVHVVSFDFRSDANSGASNDEPTLYNQDTAFATNTGLGYMVRPVSGFWSIYNGGRNSGGFSAANWVATTIAYIPGSTYHFDITVDPTSGSFDVMIDGTDFDAGASEVFGFRSGTFTNKSYVNFSVKGTTTAARTFDIDNLAVTVPEPAALGLLLLSGTLMLRRKRA